MCEHFYLQYKLASGQRITKIVASESEGPSELNGYPARRGGLSLTQKRCTCRQNRRCRKRSSISTKVWRVSQILHPYSRDFVGKWVVDVSSCSLRRVESGSIVFRQFDAFLQAQGKIGLQRNRQIRLPADDKKKGTHVRNEMATK